MVDVYVNEMHPYYLVFVDGSIYDEIHMRHGSPLTWSQQWDIARGYAEALDTPKESVVD